MHTNKCILHPTDFSAAGEAAFAEALRTARRQRCELTFVHVLEGLLPLRDERYAAAALKARAAAEAAARRRLDRRLARAKKAGLAASAVVVEGWPPEQIAKVAKRRHAHLIVMGTHGRAGIRKILLGSVAERVIAMAPCPVLTVRRSTG